MNNAWPSATEYRKLLRTPADVFRDPWLRRAQAAAVDPRSKLPFGLSGARGTVFEMTDGTTTVAAKLFFGLVEDRHRRFQAICDHCRPLGCGSLLKFDFDPEGFFFNGLALPVQTMAWVKAPKLDEWVSARAEERDSDRIRRLADHWIDLVAELVRLHIAHGDLQHGNILVRSDDSLQLVDYDGMYVPALINEKPEEFGLEGYQHPKRQAEQATLHQGLDSFSAWVILIGLRAAASQPELWWRFVGHDAKPDRWLFTFDDLDNPATSPVWPRLFSSPDAEVRAWAELLHGSLSKPFADIPPFEPYPLGQLEQACGNRNWPEVLRLAALPSVRARTWPAELKQAVTEAERREGARRQTEAATSAGDLARVEPALLDDWPQLRYQVDVARRLAPVLEELERTGTIGAAGQRFVDLWDRHAALLVSHVHLVDVARLHAAAEEARHVQACQRACAEMDQASEDGDVHALARVWQRMRDVGRQADLQQYQQLGERAIEQSAVLQALERISAEPGEANDTAFFQTWDGKLLNSKVLAGPLGDCVRARFQNVCERIAKLNPVRCLLAKSPTPDIDDELTLKASLFPANYRWLPESHSRIDEAGRRAQERATAIRQLRSAVTAQDWDTVQKKANESPLSGWPLPTELAEAVKEATQRLCCRDEVRQALQDRDLQRLAGLAASAALLDAWPDLRRDVAAAQSVWVRLEQLERHLADDRGGQRFHEHWQECEAELQAWLDREPVARLAEKAREIGANRATLQELVDAAQRWDHRSLVAIWERLPNPDLYAEANKLGDQVSRARQCNGVLDRLGLVTDELTEASDRAFYRVWDATLLRGSAEAARWHERYTRVCTTICILNDLGPLLDADDGPAGDDNICKLADRLPAGYRHDRQVDIERARARRRLASVIGNKTCTKLQLSVR